MSRKITDDKREEMFVAWQEKQTVNSVELKCGVHNATVKKYRTLDKWDDRLKKISVKVKRKVDNGLVGLKAEHAKTGQYMRGMGIKKLASMEPEAKLELTTMSGKAELKINGAISGEFNLKSISGEIDSCFGPEVPESKYSTGSSVRFTKGDGHAEVRISTMSGDIKLCDG